MEREEDEGGMLGETFTDYVSVLHVLFFSLEPAPCLSAKFL